MQEGELYVLLPMLIAVATGARRLPDLIAGGLLNPDSYMRLVRLEAALPQHALGYVVARDGSGAGTLLHWSHLLDSLLCLMAAPLALFMDPNAALHAVALAFGPLCLGGLGLALAWAVAPLAEPGWRWLAPVIASLSAAIVSYGLPGVVHHHVPLLIVAVMTAGFAVRAALGLAGQRAGLAMGAWAGVGIWLSPESMPFTLMAFGGVWLAWLLGRDLAPLIAQAAAGFMVVVAAGVAVDPPYAGYAAAEIDRISLVYLALAAAIGTIALVAPRYHSVTARLVIPALCLGAWVALFPALLRGTGGVLTEQETRAMFGGISEMLPVRNTGEVIGYLLTGALSAAFVAWLAVTRRSLLLGYAALCAGALELLGATHIRFAAYPAAAAAAMLPILMTRCTSLLAGWPHVVPALARVALLVLFALLPRAEGLGLFSPATAATNTIAPSCALHGATTMLTGYAGAVVLADPGNSPELLYRTDVRTVGSLYHRNAAAFMRLRSAWRSGPSDTVPDTVRATGATLLLFCPSPARSLLVADLPRETLLDRLNRGEVPPWLHQVASDPSTGNLLYEVMP